VLTTAFAQNQRDEVRDLNDCAGALAAEPGMKQQTFVASFMGGQGSKAGGLGYREEVSPSLKSVPSGGNTVPDIVQAVHQNASGEVRESDVSYTVGTNQNASGRNTPLIHEKKESWC
jgi:DNA (cytosine-5)-methyltransferase 1